MSYFNNINTTLSDGAQLDAFGRLRISQPDTLFDSKQTISSGSLTWDDQQVSGTGTTSAWSKDRASTTLSVSSTTAGKRTRRSKSTFNYQPGKSQEILMTFVLGPTVSGVTKRVGYFNDDNGLFLECNGTNLGVVVRSNVSGSPVDTRVAQSSWNLDKLDGSGRSGIVLDQTKSQILFIDFEWLGVGRVRYGFVIDGNLIYVHEAQNANINDSVYMSTPNLPVEWSIENDGTGAAASLEVICCTIISEGGGTKTGVNGYVSTGGVHLDANVADTIYAVIGLRLTGSSCSTVQISAIDMLSETADAFEWIVLQNPTIAGTFTYSPTGSESCVESAFGVTANTVTGGTPLGGGYASSTGNRQVISQVKRSIGFGQTIAGVQDEIVLCVRPLGTNSDIQASINFQEIQ